MDEKRMQEIALLLAKAEAHEVAKSLNMSMEDLLCRKENPDTYDLQRSARCLSEHIGIEIDEAKQYLLALSLETINTAIGCYPQKAA